MIAASTTPILALHRLQSSTQSARTRHSRQRLLRRSPSGWVTLQRELFDALSSTRASGLAPLGAVEELRGERTLLDLAETREVLIEIARRTAPRPTLEAAREAAEELSQRLQGWAGLLSVAARRV